jgi:ABC-type branched-subunit amino acid transport system ATPase component
VADRGLVMCDGQIVSIGAPVQRRADAATRKECLGV